MQIVARASTAHVCNLVFMKRDKNNDMTCAVAKQSNFRFFTLCNWLLPIDADR